MNNPANFCRIEAATDANRAGWHVLNSVNVDDIVPVWTVPGGGRLSDNMTRNLSESIEVAKKYTRQRIVDAERHLAMLEAAS